MSGGLTERAPIGEDLEQMLNDSAFPATTAGWRRSESGAS